MLISALGSVVGAGSAAGSSENPAGSAVATVDAPNTGVIEKVASADDEVRYSRDGIGEQGLVVALAQPAVALE